MPCSYDQMKAASVVCYIKHLYEVPYIIYWGYNHAGCLKVGYASRPSAIDSNGIDWRVGLPIVVNSATSRLF